MYKNMAWSVQPHLLPFQSCGKCIGHRGNLASLSNIFRCDIVCILQFSLQMAKVQSIKCRNVLNLYKFRHTTFLMATCVLLDVFKPHSAPVSLACYVVYSAGLHLQSKTVLFHLYTLIIIIPKSCDHAVFQRSL